MQRWFATRNSFTTYLWGIETNNNTIGLLVWNIFTTYLWGIETCLSGTISKYHEEFTTYLWGIETYVISFNIKISKAIYYLPMRNWNNSKPSFFKLLIKIYYLPMRNWNQWKVWTTDCGCSIYYLPMRNWNRSIYNNFEFNQYYLLLTYEELKHVSLYITIM